MRRWLLLGAMVLAAAGGVRGDDRFTWTAVVGGHTGEVAEGYFTLGDGLMLMVRPDTPLYAWLARHEGRRITLHLEAEVGTE